MKNNNVFPFKKNTIYLRYEKHANGNNLIKPRDYIRKGTWFEYFHYFYITRRIPLYIQQRLKNKVLTNSHDDFSPSSVRRNNLK